MAEEGGGGGGGPLVLGPPLSGPRSTESREPRVMDGRLPMEN